MITKDKLKVLVVDDSPIFRRAMMRALEQLPEVDLVGSASNGGEALDKIRGLNPDLVTLDMEMPVMDGLATLRALRNQGLKTRVLMLSAFGGEKRTVEALCLGAEDFILKPSMTPGGALTALRDLLQSKLTQFFKGATCSPARSPMRVSAPPQRTSHSLLKSPEHPINGVVIGVSTGGPNALADLLSQFERPMRVPILIVQHMPAGFTKLLAERLATKCVMPVQEAIAQQPLQPGSIYVAPGDFHLEISGNAVAARANLQQGPPENACRPSADVLFRSAARHFGSGCLAVIMTGMGKDGLVGCQAIRSAGGYCLAQDRESCVVWGMPKFVTEAGLADEIHPLNKLGTRIQELVESGYRRK